VEHNVFIILQKEAIENVAKGFIILKVQSLEKVVYIYCQNSRHYDFDYLSGFQKLKIILHLNW